MATYHYVVLHQSLAKLAGAAASQAIHAATESLRSLPVPEDTHAAILEADTSEDLASLADGIAAAGFKVAVIREPDAPYNGAITAVACEPFERDRIRGLFDGFAPLGSALRRMKATSRV